MHDARIFQEEAAGLEQTPALYALWIDFPNRKPNDDGALRLLTGRPWKGEDSRSGARPRLFDFVFDLNYLLAAPRFAAATVGRGEEEKFRGALLRCGTIR